MNLPPAQPNSRDGVGIANAIAAAATGTNTVTLPPGDYTLRDTLDLRSLGPCTIQGAGYDTGDGFTRVCTRLIWAGPAGKPMIRLESSGSSWRNFALDGAGTAGAGIVFGYSPGWGCAQVELDRVSITGVNGPCLQAGEHPDDQNAADFFFRRMTLRDSLAGFVVKHDQGVNYHFDGCSYSGLDTVFDIQRGGGLYVRGGGGGYCDTFLRTGAGGPNTGVISLRDLRIERAGKHNRYMQVLDAPDSAGGTNVIFDGFWMADGVYDGAKPDAALPTLSIGSGVAVSHSNSLLRAIGAAPLTRIASGGRFANLDDGLTRTD